MLLAITTLIIFFLPFYIVYKPPASLISYFQYRWPDIIWQVSTSEKVLALTIDDGPTNNSRDIARVMSENEATATWFVIGSHTANREDVLVDLIKNGHELGNHGMYDEPARSLSGLILEQQIRDVEKTIDKAYRTAGVKKLDQKSRYYRPGSGFFSVRIRTLVKDLGYQLVLGGIYPHDPQIPYWKVNAAHILSMVRPGGIIICHDRPWTAKMLARVLPELKRRGYKVVTLTELLKHNDLKKLT